jgi:hypothetical protein
MSSPVTLHHNVYVVLFDHRSQASLDFAAQSKPPAIETLRLCWYDGTSS